MSKTPLLNKLVIVGVGLIGGSLARALRAVGEVKHIVGVGRDAARLRQAVELGVIDSFALSCADAVEDADVIILATPIYAMVNFLAELRPLLKEGQIVTDVGSVKGEVVAIAQRELGGRFSSFVPGHPIAGGEKSGAAASSEKLFIDHYVILTPTGKTSKQATAKVTSMWKLVGARVVEQDPVQHDGLLAACSHLPHVLAYNLVRMLVKNEQRKALFEFSAGGFRDFTRIASSDPAMWRDICLSNRVALGKVLGEYRQALDELAQYVEQGNGEALHDAFKEAKVARDTHVLAKQQSGIN